MSEVIKLISYTGSVNEYGDPVLEESSREVFADLLSIGQKEFYQAQAVGLQPEYKFRLSDYFDYTGESYVEHDGVLYRVLRTYRTGKALELTVYREVNQNGRS